MKKMFMSFSTKDELIVNEIYLHLKNEFNIFKFNRTPETGGLQQIIMDNMESANIFLIFISKDSAQSKAVKDEFCIAKHREINDKDFKLIPVYLEEFKRINWTIDSQLRIEAFGDEPLIIAKKIKNLIEGKKNEYKINNLKMSYQILENNLWIKSERKISLPTVLFQLKDLNEENTPSISYDKKTQNKGYTWKTKILTRVFDNASPDEKHYIKWVEHDELKYIGQDKPIQIKLRDIGVKDDKIEGIWLIDNFGDSYPLKLEKEETWNHLNIKKDDELWWTPHAKSSKIYNEGHQKLKKWLSLEIKDESLLIEAKQLLEKSISIFDSMNSRLTLGSILRHLKKHNESLELYETILLFNPNFLDAYTSIGNVYSDDDFFDYDKSLFHYNKGIDIKKTANALRCRGNLYAKTKKYSKALQDWEESYSIEKNETLRQAIEWLKLKI